jgi:hypothetical protein
MWPCYTELVARVLSRHWTVSIMVAIEITTKVRTIIGIIIPISSIIKCENFCYCLGKCMLFGVMCSLDRAGRIKSWPSSRIYANGFLFINKLIFSFYVYDGVLYLIWGTWFRFIESNIYVIHPTSVLETQVTIS